jgi:hypothetical protein
MITVNGGGKNFFTITGLDGLTIGITDFATTGGIQSFMKIMNQHAHDAVVASFSTPDHPEHVEQATSNSWIASNNGPGPTHKDNDDKGLVAQDFFRLGLNRLLCQRSTYGIQLHVFNQGKVKPGKAIFDRAHFVFEVTLAAIIGIANSGGPGMASRFLAAALLDGTIAAITDPEAKELAVCRLMLKTYADGQPNRSEKDLEKTTYNLGVAFGDAEGALYTGSQLQHRGGRVRYVLQLFPPLARTRLGDLGRYSLAPVEKFAGDPLTS